MAAIFLASYTTPWDTIGLWGSGPDRSARVGEKLL
jgi:hypothetical protein